MIGIKYRLVENELQDELDSSKFFGSPVFPEGLLECLDPDDVFIGQINLEDIKNYNDVLPKEGVLYFFININMYPYQGKVVYSNKERYLVVDDINDEFIEGYQIPKAMYMEFYEVDDDINTKCEYNWEDFGIQMLGDYPDFIEEEYCLTDYRCLLMIDAMEVEIFPNFGSYDGYIFFMIREEDLINQNFNDILLITWDS